MTLHKFSPHVSHNVQMHTIIFQYSHRHRKWSFTNRSGKAPLRVLEAPWFNYLNENVWYFKMCFWIGKYACLRVKVYNPWTADIRQFLLISCSMPEYKQYTIHNIYVSCKTFKLGHFLWSKEIFIRKLCVPSMQNFLDNLSISTNLSDINNY